MNGQRDDARRRGDAIDGLSRPAAGFSINSMKNRAAMECIEADAEGLIDAAEAESMAAAQIIAVDVRAAAKFDQPAVIIRRGLITGPLRFKIHAIASDQTGLSTKANESRQSRLGRTPLLKMASPQIALRTGNTCAHVPRQFGSVLARRSC